MIIGGVTHPEGGTPRVFSRQQMAWGAGGNFVQIASILKLPHLVCFETVLFFRKTSLVRGLDLKIK